MTTPPAAVIDAITAALVARALPPGSKTTPFVRERIERTARLDALAAWDALAGVCHVSEIQERRHRVTGAIAADTDSGDDLAQYRRVLVVTPAERIDPTEEQP